MLTCEVLLGLAIEDRVERYRLLATNMDLLAVTARVNYRAQYLKLARQWRVLADAIEHAPAGRR